MNNFEIIKSIEQIVCPYFQFNMDDFYGNIVGREVPKIEELNILFFKLNGYDKKLYLSKNDQEKMVDKIKDLNIGLVEINSIQSYGRYIIITLYKNEKWVGSILNI